jgi:hypothetical protein
MKVVSPAMDKRAVAASLEPAKAAHGRVPIGGTAAALAGLALAALVLLCLGYNIRRINARKVPQAIGERGFTKMDTPALTELEEFF